jgi:hypothetical protein
MLPSTTNTTVSVSCSLMEKFAHSSNGFSRVAEERGKRPAPNAISVDVLGIDVADESQLREITAAGGGKYYSASNFAEINKALSQSVQSASVAPAGPELALGAAPGVPLELAIILTSVVACLIIVGGSALWIMRPSRRRARGLRSGDGRDASATSLVLPESAMPASGKARHKIL